MERLRTLFISLYLPLVCVLGLWALWRALWPWALPLRLDWYGAVLACLALPVWCLLLRLRHPPREQAHLPCVTLLTWLGACLAVFGTLLNDDPGWLPLGCVAFALAGYLLFLLWYSWRPEAVLPVQPGMALPPLSLRTADGALADDALSGEPVLWLFFRGNWSPLCRGQVAELLAMQPALAGRGARLVLVSPQSVETTRALLPEQADVLVCQDTGQAAASLGLLRRGAVPLWWRLLGVGADTVQPALMLTDGEGDLIRLEVSHNERTRPLPAMLIRMLERGNGRP